MKVKEISFFTPAWNEEAHIETTVTKVDKILKKIAQKYEIIIVNDGSQDKTGEIADRLARDNERIRVIHHPNNFGYGEALKSGFYNARYQWIAMMDIDGQFDFAEITKFLEKTNQAEAIWGYRINRQDPWLRKFFGWTWTMLANSLLGFKVRDADCGFKLVRKEVIDTIPRLVSGRGGMISPELLAKAQKAGFKMTEVGVHHYPRQKGHQSGVDFNVIFRSFFDLLRLWWKLFPPPPRRSISRPPRRCL